MSTATQDTANPTRHAALGTLAPVVAFRPPADESRRQMAARLGLLQHTSVEQGFEMDSEGWARRGA